MVVAGSSGGQGQRSRVKGQKVKRSKGQRSKGQRSKARSRSKVRLWLGVRSRSKVRSGQGSPWGQGSPAGQGSAGGEGWVTTRDASLFENLESCAWFSQGTSFDHVSGDVGLHFVRHIRLKSESPLDIYKVWMECLLFVALCNQLFIPSLMCVSR